MARNKPNRVRVTGPLQPHAAGLRTHLKEIGYTSPSSANLLRVLAHLSRWLKSARLRPGELRVPQLNRFLRARRAAGCARWRSMRGLAPVLDYLREIGVAPPATGPIARTAVEYFVERYRTFLRVQRGLVATTIAYYVHLVRGFIAEHGGVETDFSRLTAKQVTRFVVRECRRLPVGSAKLLVSALRSLLRFLHMEGLTAFALSSAVPAVAGWRLSNLPRDVEPRVVRLLIDGCDRRTVVGRRDYAVLLLLARLGLRAGEVAALQLEDVDWRRGEIVVRGKGGLIDTLPLPADVGEAVASFLSRGRPRTAQRAIFLSCRAPLRPASSGLITAVVRNACVRAGVPAFGAHRLRHTAASRMLQSGASLAEVGQVLRHRSLQSTAIYAKVDRSSLRELVQAWPVIESIDGASLRALAQRWPGGDA